MFCISLFSLSVYIQSIQKPRANINNRPLNKPRNPLPFQTLDYYKRLTDFDFDSTLHVELKWYSQRTDQSFRGSIDWCWGLTSIYIVCFAWTINWFHYPSIPYPIPRHTCQLVQISMRIKNSQCDMSDAVWYVKWPRYSSWAHAFRDWPTQSAFFFNANAMQPGLWWNKHICSTSWFFFLSSFSSLNIQHENKALVSPV